MVSPTPSTCDRQLARIRSTIKSTYSGQQKSSTSSREPLPALPPVDKPKPCPRAPVSANADPRDVSLPLVGVRPRASSGATLIGVAGARTGLAPGLGIVISGVL